MGWKGPEGAGVLETDKAASVWGRGFFDGGKSNTEVKSGNHI
jgi:hypothetical protein